MKSKSLVHSFFDEDADGKYRPKCGGIHYEEEGLNPRNAARLQAHLLFHNPNFREQDPSGYSELVRDISLHGTPTQWSTQNKLAFAKAVEELAKVAHDYSSPTLKSGNNNDARPATQEDVHAASAGTHDDFETVLSAGYKAISLTLKQEKGIRSHFDKMSVEEKDVIESLLARFVLLQRLPLHTLDKPEWIEVLKVLRPSLLQHGKVAGYDRLRKCLIEKMFNDVQRQVHAIIDRSAFHALILDGHEELGEVHNMNLVKRLPCGACFFVGQETPQGEPQNVAFLNTLCEDSLEHEGCVGVTSDNPTVMRSFRKCVEKKTIQKTGLPKFNSGCGWHAGDLVIEDITKQKLDGEGRRHADSLHVDVVTRLSKLADSVHKWFKKSVRVAAMMRTWRRTWAMLVNTTFGETRED